MDPSQNLCATAPKAGAHRALCIAGVAIAAVLTLAIFTPRASADLPGVPGSAAVDDVTQAAAPVTNQVTQPATQAATPVVDQATQAVAPVVRPTTEAAAPVINDVARATSQVSRPAADQVSRVASSVISAGQDTAGSAGELTSGTTDGQPAPRHATSTPASTHGAPPAAATAPAKPRAAAPQFRHSFSLAHNASSSLAQPQMDGSNSASAAGRPSASSGGGTEPSRQPGGRPSPAPAPLHGPATEEGAVATGGSGGGLGASGAIVFTFILAASLGLRRFNLASDPLGPAPLVLLPERPG